MRTIYVLLTSILALSGCKKDTQNATDNSAPYQFKANWLQAGSYTLTVNNTEVRTFQVQ